MTHRLVLQSYRYAIRVSNANGAPIACRYNSSLPLGIRKSLPPDHINTPPPPSHDKESSEPQISDQEWEIRTGRAVNVIQQTLPEFFTVGLITSIDKVTGEPRPSSPASLVPPVIGSTLPDVDNDTEQIYSPKVRLSYTPPGALPSPFPKTFKAEGLSLYIMSSVFVRHTFNMLYTDITVALNKVTINDPHMNSNLPHADRNSILKPSRTHRERSLFVGLTVHGTSRMSGTPGEWEVNSTYTFSPLSGLVHTHTVDSIHPAPHLAVYENLRLNLSNLFGFQAEGRTKPQIEPATTRRVRRNVDDSASAVAQK